MERSVDHVRRDVQRTFADVVGWAESKEPSPDGVRLGARHVLPAARVDSEPARRSAYGRRGWRSCASVPRTACRARRRPRQRVDGTRRHGRRLRRREHPRKRRAKGDKSKNANWPLSASSTPCAALPRASRDPSTRGSSRPSRATKRSSCGCTARRSSVATARSRQCSLLMALSISGVFRRSTSPTRRCVWTGTTSSRSSGPRASASTPRAPKSCVLRRRAGHPAAQGTVLAVIEALRNAYASTPKTGPNNKGKRDRLDKILKHLVENQSRLRYRHLRRQDLDIGTGAAEGAVRNLIGIRLDGPGMRWSRGRSERLLHLRCVLLNGLWDVFANHLAAGNPISLRSSPIATQTHAAKRNEAA